MLIASHEVTLVIEVLTALLLPHKLCSPVRVGVDAVRAVMA
eukprot:CAMPEP_0170187734 /NCGR_PEP_ID=MMETSP0040_2-20121228/42466_1 /TAXON_ID=641309 /ORGANISM="Lotharella oceanica, Strain CCMP622" /LENGTH=40 /DNA_ID= /DNA_START= /DNA_END= /DNA_ORIENTATION=